MKSKEIFWRTVKITSIIIFNIVLLIYGVCYAYKNIRLVGYGEYAKIIETDDENIKIFDFYMKRPDYLK